MSAEGALYTRERHARALPARASPSSSVGIAKTRQGRELRDNTAECAHAALCANRASDIWDPCSFQMMVCTRMVGSHRRAP
jgi:hypothetical protein